MFTIFDEKLNVVIDESKDNESENYKIDIIYQHYDSNGPSRIDRTLTDAISGQLVKIANYSTKDPIIGTYLNSMKEIILFFRIEDKIKYCAIDQVFNYFRNKINLIFYLRYL